MLSRLRKRIAREGMFERDGCIGAAVSGGADSVALLHALCQLYPGREIAAVHLNHCLRGDDSDADEAFVRELAAELGCAQILRRAEVAEQARRSGENLEAAGRRARYAFFGDLLRDRRCSVIATAHTRSDQAETVLFRLMRGAGGAGLSGILPRRDDSVVRPMLDVGRPEVIAYLQSHGLAWREDSTNADPSFARNRLRRQLLPQLREQWNPAIEAVLANTADWALEETRYWESRIDRLRGTCTMAAGAGRGGGIVLDVMETRSLHTAAQRRLLHSLLVDMGTAPSFVHVEALRRLLTQRRGSGATDLPGLRAERSFGSVLLQRSGAREFPEYELEVPVPGFVELPAPGWGALRTSILGPQRSRSLYNQSETALLDWDKVPRPLRVRGWRPGDGLTPVGRAAPRKLRDLFQEHRVEGWLRPGWPVVIGGSGRGSLVWAGQFGLNAAYCLVPPGRRGLLIEASGPDGPKPAAGASKGLGGAAASRDKKK